MSSPVLQPRLTRAVRAQIEKDALALVREVRSNKRVAARDKRAIEGFLAPLLSASSSATDAVRLAVAQAEAFTIGMGVFEAGAGHSCTSLCRANYESCRDVFESNPWHCVLRWMRCTMQCRS